MKRLIALLLSLVFLCGCTTLTQVRLDAEVDRRCREDGGVKIYETAPLAPKLFNKYMGVYMLQAEWREIL